jgi:thiamine biosynthesis lipoprotein
MTAGESSISIDRWRTRLSLITRGGSVSRSGLAQLITSEADRMETAASRFVATSEVSRVNAAPGEWVDVSWYFLTVLTAALDAAEQTDGIVDPCLGGLVDRAGYRIWRDGAAVADSSLRVSRPGSWRGIEIRPARGHGQVRLPVDAQLDLGALAKAWLADRLAEKVADQGIEVIADMGGDIRAIAFDRPWVVGADSGRPEIESPVFGVADTGLATSGRNRRRWESGGRAGHHIIDPRTGEPAVTPWWTVSVMAATAVGANTASTAAMVLGSEAPQWLSRAGLDAFLVPAQADGGAALTIGRWPAEEEVS